MEDELSTVSTLSSETLKAGNPSNLSHGKDVRVSRFRGVWKQKNGHWGAQIYTSGRIWVGTFRSETEAAMAYDSASLKLRKGDSRRNFPWNRITVQEPEFQKQFSSQAVLDMIKDHSYPTKFAEFLRKPPEIGSNLDGKHVDGMISCTELFRKELTPSDVGKLNRLVIPKKCALRHFPSISEDAKENSGSGDVDTLLLKFFDTSNKLWQFRYCYWKSSQSFVFTKGWNRFVKEKDLKVNDEVIFYKCEPLKVSSDVQSYYMINVSYSNRMNSNGLTEENIGMAIRQEKEESGNKDEEESEIVPISGQCEAESSKSIRLFGVQIFQHTVFHSFV